MGNAKSVVPIEDFYRCIGLYSNSGKIVLYDDITESPTYHYLNIYNLSLCWNGSMEDYWEIVKYKSGIFYLQRVEGEYSTLKIIPITDKKTLLKGFKFLVKYKRYRWFISDNATRMID